MSGSAEIYDSYLAGDKPPNYKTWSGIELKELYDAGDKLEETEIPGEYPFTRGIHRDMYRKRFWTRRQQSGFGTPAESNERMKFLLREGQTGLNLNLDVPGELGLDADHPLAEGDVGLVGTSLSTLEDAEQLFYLEWVKKYLFERKVKETQIWQSLGKALRRHRHPFVYRLIEQTEHLLEEVGRRTLPAPVRHWLWVKWQSYKNIIQLGGNI